MFNGSALGKTVNISGGLYEIVGVLKEESDSKQGGSDDAVYLPYSVASRIAGKNSSTIYFASDDNNITSMQMLTYNFEVVSEGTVTQARMIIENYLMDVYKSRDAFYVRSMAEMLKEMNTMISVLITVLAAIAAISLFVGGIGIMNIMLISVSERTKEIGIRKSLGAKQWHIMCQFVIEAATTSALGGLAGIGFGYLLSMAGTKHHCRHDPRAAEGCAHVILRADGVFDLGRYRHSVRISSREKSGPSQPHRRAPL